MNISFRVSDFISLLCLCQLAYWKLFLTLVCYFYKLYTHINGWQVLSNMIMVGLKLRFKNRFNRLA